MRTAPLAFLAVLLFAGPAHAQDRTGYLDVSRALSESADGKKAITELADAHAACDKQNADAEAARKKDPKAKVTAPRQCAIEHSNGESRASNEIYARMKRIFPAVLKSRKLAVLQVAIYADPRLDVTDELIRRLNAGEGKVDPVADAVKAKDAEIASLKAQLEKRSKQSPKPPEQLLPDLDPRPKALVTTKP